MNIEKKELTLKAIACALLVCIAMIMSGCSKTEKTVAGALIGGGLGVGVGAAAGGAGGAIAGGAVGAAAGGVVGSQVK